MQLKGLVRFFAFALILICLYQLSFTWIVRSYESNMNDKAALWVKANFPTPQAKYPGNKALQNAYKDSLENFKKARLKRLLDSTEDSKIGPFGLTTYRSAKDKELMLGLDLQGGMSVTMEVGLDGLIKSLANYTKDVVFNKALNAAVQKKATSGADLITLFAAEFKNASNGNRLAPYFIARSNGAIKAESSDDAVISYLRDQANSAFQNTVRILSTRIDRFGVASPNINPDPKKGIINIELAGVNDPERVRKYLQSTANLQFFEVYNLQDIDDNINAAQKTLSDYLKGTTDTLSKDTAKQITDTAKANTAAATSQADTNAIAGFNNIQNNNGSKTAAKTKTTTDSTEIRRKEYPIQSLVQFIPPQQGEDGKMHFSPELGYVSTNDTGLLNSYLNLDFIKNKFPANLIFMYGKPEQKEVADRNLLSLYAIKTLDNGQAKLDGSHVRTARQDFDERGAAAISMDMDPQGTTIWGKMTTENKGKPIAIALDNFVYSAPNVLNAITTGNSQITGNFTVQTAQDLANILQSGKLPAPARIVAEQQVGPTLGQDAVRGGSLAFLISFIVIFILMLVYYNTAGWVANIALILNLLFTIGILSTLNFKLTAPGIAGLVLTIGMAVDTNVIIFERIKEELTRGKSYILAVSDGYKRSYAPVIDAHVTTFLTAAILFIFGLGPVLGFATTQMLGISLSLFCGILVSRLITDFYTNKQRHFNYFTGISRRVFKHAAFKFIEYRKIAYGLSVIVLILGVGSFFNGFDEGVEFKGGRSYTILFDQAYNTTDVADTLKPYLDEYPIIKTVVSANQLEITTSYLINQTGQNVDSTVEAKLYEGLKSYLPAGTSYHTFDTKYKKASQTVQPSISDDLKKGAKTATIVSIIMICLYIFIRFRDWRYSLGTIVSLLHDVFVTLAVFSFLRKVVPFPLEIDQYFIAAILTVIGFSMNDTIIVYDRIREDSRLMKGSTKEEIINRAINQTLSRTIMTSLTVFLTLLILFIFGGQVTHGFAFAMLIGVITGTYSSIFVAAPILIDFARDKPLGSAETKKKT
jgi:SecD/SecF fusion protein